MIYINELRKLAQAATQGPDGVSLNWLKLLQDFQKEANPAVINELLDRLEAAEKERDDLLEALKWMVLRTEEGGYPDGKCLEEARAAIAKATGDQP